LTKFYLKRRPSKKKVKPRPLDKGFIDGRIIIFEHWSSVIKFLPSVEKHIYIITDSRLYNSEEMLKPHTYRPVFLDNMDEAIKSGKNIILMLYNPALAFFTQEFVTMVDEKTNDKVVCVSFFHDDVDSSLFQVEGIKNMLDFKFVIIKSMLSFPFIKKITVPFNFKVSIKYLTDLFNELIT